MTDHSLSSSSSPLPVAEAASWNRTEPSIREAKLQRTLAALDSDRFASTGTSTASGGTVGAVVSGADTSGGGATAATGASAGRGYGDIYVSGPDVDANSPTVGSLPSMLPSPINDDDCGAGSSPRSLHDDNNVSDIAKHDESGAYHHGGGRLDDGQGGKNGNQNNGASDQMTQYREQLSYCSNNGGGSAGNNNKPSIFLGELPPRHHANNSTSAAAQHMHSIPSGSNHHRHQQHQPQPPSHIDIGSCGSSIISTDMDINSTGGAQGGNNDYYQCNEFNRRYRQNEAESCSAAAAAAASEAMARTGLRVPAARVTPGSQLDHSLATTIDNDNINTATDDQGSSVISAGGTASTNCYSYSEAENESLAWRKALEDGPGRIRCSVEQEAAAASASRTNVSTASIGIGKNGRPPLGHSTISTAAARSGGIVGATTPTASTQQPLLNASSLSDDRCAASIATTPTLSSAILSQNQSLQHRVAHDAQRMEEMAVAEAEAREELVLLRSQYGGGAGKGGRGGDLLPSLEELRGKILHRTREDLAAASSEVVHLRSQLEEAHATAEACQATISVENSALREEVRKLSTQLAQRAILGGLESSSSAAASPILDRRLADRVTSAEATAAELRRQLEASKDTAEREADRAAKAERERDALREEAALAAERLAAARNEARDVRRDRDGLRGELNELLRARKNPEGTMEREFGAETDRLRRLAVQAKEDAERKVQEVEQLDSQRKKDLERARRGELKASKDAEKLRQGLKALVDQLRSLERAGELGGVGVNEILVSSQGNLDGILFDTSGDETRAPINTTKDAVPTLTQTDAAATERKQKSTESVGINTTVTASVAANLYAESLQTKSDLHSSELRVSQLQQENANLRGKCEHIQAQLSRYEQRKKEESVSSATKAKEDDDRLRRLSQLSDDLKTKNARLEQDNASLLEAKAYIEDQNREVVKRGVELEQLAEESEAEVERLSKELQGAKAKLGRHSDAEDEVKELEDDKFRMQAEWEEARRECELLQQELLDTTERLEECRTLEKELNARIDVLSAKNDDLSERLLATEEASRTQREEMSTISKSKVEYEWQCTNLKEENAALNEKLEFYQSDADARDEKYNIVVMEKLDLEKAVKEFREEIDLVSEARATAQGEASQLKKENASIKAEFKTCAEEWRAIKGKFDLMIKEKVMLEKKVTTLEAQYDAISKSKAEVEAERDRLFNENESAKGELSSCERRLCDVTDRLDRVLDEKEKLREKIAASEREWRDVCVQASLLIQSPEAKSAESVRRTDASNSPVALIATNAAHVQTDAWTTPGPSTSMIVEPPDSSSSDVSMMKNILVEIHSSRKVSQAEKEDVLLKTRLEREREVESIRISLETAQEHILRLKSQIPTYTTADERSAAEDASFEERILRIKEAREKASLARAYQDRLKDLASPAGKAMLKADSEQQSGRQLLLDSKKRGSARRDAINKNMADLRSLRAGEGQKAQRQHNNSALRASLAETTNSSVQPVYLMMSPTQIKTPSVSAVATTTTTGDTKFSIGTPLDATTARLDFAETEAFVLSILDSVGRQ